MKLLREKKEPLLLFLGAAIFLFAHLWPWLDFVRITPFGSRDLQRASDWWGMWYPYGPELSGSSHTPGPFLYVLLSLPLKLGADWQGVSLFRAALYATSGAALFSYFWRKYSPLEAALILLSVASSGLLRQEFTWDWSASFAPPFVGFWLYLALNHQQKLGRWLAAVGVISLGCQIHLNLLILYPITALLYWRDPPISKEKNKVALLLCATLLPYIPFLAWVFAGETLFPHLRPTNFSAIQGGVEALLVKTDPFRFDYLPRAKEAIYDIFIHNPIPWFFIFLSLALRPKFTFKREQINWPITAFFLLTGILALLMLVAKTRYYQTFHLALAIAPILWFFNRQKLPSKFLVTATAAGASLLVILFSPTIGTLTALLMVNLSLLYAMGEKHSRPKLVLLLSLLGILSFGKNYWEVSEEAKKMAAPKLLLTMPQYLESTPLALGPLIKKVREETGWTCEELNQKIFALRMKEFFDLKKFCGSVKISPGKKRESWSGVFLLPKMIGNSDGKESVKKWIMSSSPMLPDIKILLDSGKIFLHDPIGSGDVWVVPYKLETNSLSPLEEMHNSGYAYQPTPDDSWMAKIHLTDAQGILTKDGAQIFYWNYCLAEKTADCRVFAMVEPSSDKIRVRLSGAPLSARHPLLQPALAVTWKGFEISYYCDGTWHKSPLLSEIGSDMFEEYRHPTFVTGPISVSTETHCRGKLEKVKLGIGEIQVRHSNDQRTRFKGWQSAEKEL